MKNILIATSLMLLFAGCGTSNFPAGAPSLDAGAAFPHLAGWTDSTNHGAYVLQKGLAACEGCHGTDGSGVRYGLCASCHADYPHAEGWSSGHKASLIERGTTKDCATSCHGQDLHGGLSGRDCSSCHGQYPHGSAWQTSHSAVAANAATDIPGQQFDISPGFGTVEGCTDTCHNTSNSVGGTCNACHSSGIIHPDGWKEEHGPQVAASGTAPCATSCHGADFGGGAIAPNCTSCHAYPHGEDWKTAANHGAQAKAELTSCTDCHGEAVGFDDNYGLTVPPSPTAAPSCYSCHPAYPHISYTFNGTTHLWNTSPPAAHVFMIVRNRKLFTATTPSLNDAALVSSVEARCAGGPDGCHSAGIHTATVPGSLSCQVCHY